MNARLTIPSGRSWRLAGVLRTRPASRITWSRFACARPSLRSCRRSLPRPGCDWSTGSATSNVGPSAKRVGTRSVLRDMVRPKLPGADEVSSLLSAPGDRKRSSIFSRAFGRTLALHSRGGTGSRPLRRGDHAYCGRMQIHSQPFRLVPGATGRGGLLGRGAPGQGSARRLAVSVQEQVEIARAEDDPPDRVRIFVNGRSLSRRLIEKGLVASTPDAWNWCGPVDTSTAHAPQLHHRIRDAAGLAPSQSPGQEGDWSGQEKAP